MTESSWHAFTFYTLEVMKRVNNQSKRRDLGEKAREWIDEPYEGVEIVDERIVHVPERGGELPGGQAQRDGGGEHGPEREERDGGEGPHLVPTLPEQRRLAGRDGNRDLGRRRRRGGV